MSKPKDISIENKNFKIKFSAGGTIAALIRSAFDASTTGLPGAATLAEWVKAVGIKAPKEKQAFELVYSAILDGFRAQLQQRIMQADFFEERLTYEARELQFDVFKELDGAEYTFNCSHLSNPKALPFLQDFKRYYEEWLQEALLISENQAGVLVADYSRFFATAFFQNIMEDRSKYATLINWCNDPVLDEWDENSKREEYQNELLTYYQQPALGQLNVALPDVYVEPDFLVFDRILPEKKRKELSVKYALSPSTHFYPTGFKGNIHDYLKKHFLKGQPSSAINNKSIEQSRLLILLGQPGHGKSSFCYRTMHDLLRAPDFHGNIFFTRLQTVDKSFISDPFGELEKSFNTEYGFSFEEWIDNQHKQSNVLFLDGLDELFMVQNLTDNEVTQMINRLKRELEKRPKLHIIITSRFNYVEPQKLYEGECLLLSLGFLSLEQQKTLVEKYEKKVGENNLSIALLEKCNKEDNLDYIKQLIQLPILLQMVLISGVNVEAEQSKTIIYDRLFQEVLERKWSKDRRLKKYKNEYGFQPKHLKEYMAILAYKIYELNKGYLNKSDLERLPETGQFIRKRLKQSPEDGNLKPILKDVLTSFYLKESRKSLKDKNKKDAENEFAVEFLHKSLYEYLTAEHMWTKVKKFFLAQEGEEEEKEYKYYTLEEVQRFLQALFAKARLSKELMGNLRDIISKDRAQHPNLMEQMTKYLSKLLNAGFIHEYRCEEEADNFYTAEQQSLNTFHGFWTVLGQLNSATHEEMLPSWDTFKQQYWDTLSKKALLEAYQESTNELKEIVISRYSYDAEKVKNNQKKLEEELLQFSAWLNNKKALENINTAQFESWMMRYYYRSEGGQSKLALLEVCQKENNKTSIARLVRALAAERLEMSLDFSFLTFKEINLMGTYTPGIKWTGADLSQADLRRTDFGHAHFVHAKLTEANFFQANLSRTNFRSADLRLAYLRNANLYRADLRFADLRQANLIQADLIQANLHQVDLRHGTLNLAYLDSVDLSHANLSHAIFYRADLLYANLSHANLSHVDLRHANLHHAKVEDKDWIQNLKTNEVKGAAWIAKHYRLSEEMVSFRNIYGNENKGYELLKLGEEE